MPIATDFYATKPISIGLVRPTHVDGRPLSYNRVPQYNWDKLDPSDPLNMFIETSLWKWSFSTDFRIRIEKKRLLLDLFPNNGNITTTRVGRILSAAISRPINTQYNDQGFNVQCWTFGACGNLMYGMEHMILEWMPWFRWKQDRQNKEMQLQEFHDEMLMLRDYSEKDLREYFGIMKSVE